MLRLHSSDGRIELSKASVTVGIARRPGSVRLDRLAHAHARRDRLAGTRERTARDAREKRGTVGRALVHRAALERQVEHRRDDLEPQPAPRSAARDPSALGRDAELAKELEQVPKTEGDPLEDGSDERAAIVSKREPGEGRVRVRIGVRRTLALEVREDPLPLLQRRAPPPPSARRRMRPERAHPGTSEALRPR